MSGCMAVSHVSCLKTLIEYGLRSVFNARRGFHPCEEGVARGLFMDIRARRSLRMGDGDDGGGLFGGNPPLVFLRRGSVHICVW